MMDRRDFQEAFTLAPSGRLFWRNPPPEHAEKAGKEAGYICRGKGKNKDYWQVRLGGKTFKRSRVNFLLANGHWPEPCVDHINGDSMDDRPENLRAATYRQNAQNAAPRRGKLSGLPQGVSAHNGSFRARLTVNGKVKEIGVFATAEDASAAYQLARKEAFGAYA